MSPCNEFIEISLCRNSREVFEESSNWLRRVCKSRKASALLRKRPDLQHSVEEAGYALDKLGCVPSAIVHVRPDEAWAVIRSVASFGSMEKKIDEYVGAAVFLISTTIPVAVPCIELPIIPAEWFKEPPPSEILDIYQACRMGLRQGGFLRLQAAQLLWIHLPDQPLEKSVRELNKSLGYLVADLARAIAVLSKQHPSQKKPRKK